MKLYADSEVRRSLQMVGDLLLVVWVYLWVQVSLVVRDATLTLAEPGRQISDAGNGLAGQLRDAGRTVGDLPLVGGDVRAPFDGAGGAAERIAAAGDAQVQAVHDLAFWLALAIGAIPILIALGVYLPLRWRFIRQATAGRRFVDATEDLDLFALRAMARQPLHRLARISDDPAGAWRRGDAAVVRELAALELHDSGLSLPEPADSGGTPA
ncbi:MAG TPA: hypothetical protein VK204_20020 [Nocardioidaceae bacterium]|nr:hypothetical protein [Nocardioidaceae bacterium]